MSIIGTTLLLVIIYVVFRLGREKFKRDHNLWIVYIPDLHNSHFTAPGLIFVFSMVLNDTMSWLGREMHLEVVLGIAITLLIFLLVLFSLAIMVYFLKAKKIKHFAYSLLFFILANGVYKKIIWPLWPLKIDNSAFYK